ncbi:hypothetical protein D3C87_2098670 [compost metagenome]
MILLQLQALGFFLAEPSLPLHMGQYKPLLLKPPFNQSILILAFCAMAGAVLAVLYLALRPEAPASSALEEGHPDADAAALQARS